ncbi:MAG: HAMP domain-containing histidine kinase [Hellea sp.]|nr:HAMP domain-containing histidine kinase [Hellea sp.]
MEKFKKKTPQSLVSRLVRSAVFWMIPLLALTAMTLTWFYRSQTYKLFDEPLENVITNLIAAAETGDGAPDQGILYLTREPLDPDYQRALSGRYWMIGQFEDSGVLMPLRASPSLSGETLQLLPNVKRALDAQPNEEIRTTAQGPDEEPLRVLVRPVILPNGEPVLMAAAADVRALQSDVRRFALIATSLMLLLIAAVIFAVFWQVRNGLQPLFTLRQKVADVREGKSDHVDGVFPSEIAPLANELNTLIGHNKDIVERARTHVSNLAHGLKTPLAVLLNEAETSKSGLSKIVARQAQSMQRQVDHHLQRARAAARGQVVGVSTSVEESIQPLVRTLSRIYRDKDIEFDLDLTTGLMFRGEKRDLDEMVGNLLDNACKWTSSKVMISSGLAENEEGQITIEVGDNGSGLSEDQYGEALKRGSRLDEATPGTGFGLPIVDDLARAYNGHLSLGKSKLGGLSVTIKLPGRI